MKKNDSIFFLNEPLQVRKLIFQKFSCNLNRITYVKTAEHLCRIPVGLYSPFIVYPNAKKNVIINFAVTPETSFAVVNRPSSLLKCMKTVAMKRTIHWFEFFELLSFTCKIWT